MLFWLINIDASWGSFFLYDNRIRTSEDHQDYKRTVYLLEDHKLLFFSWKSFFSPIRWHRDSNQREDLESLNSTRYIYRYGTININTTPGLYIPSGTTLLDHNARPAQISPAIYSPPAQRSAVRSRAVRCGALRCGAVSCCAVCFLSNIKSSTGYKYVLVVDVYQVLLFFFFLFLHVCMYVFDLARPPVFSPTQSTPVLPIRT